MYDSFVDQFSLKRESSPYINYYLYNNHLWFFKKNLMYLDW